MSYSEKADMAAERAARIEYDMLKDNINRMFLTDDMSELLKMYDVAKKRIDRIFEYHHERVQELQNLM